MPLSENILTYEDCRNACDRALESPQGVLVRTKSKGAAVHLRQRMYKFRVLDRKQSVSLYPDQADPRHGRSVYDVLNFEAVDSVVYVKKNDPSSMIIEEISDAV